MQRVATARKITTGGAFATRDRERKDVMRKANRHFFYDTAHIQWSFYSSVAGRRGNVYNVPYVFTLETGGGI